MASAWRRDRSNRGVEGRPIVRPSALFCVALPPALDRYIGYYEPYATSHQALDRDPAVQEDVRNVARSLAAAVQLARDGRFERTDGGVRDPRPK